MESVTIQGPIVILPAEEYKDILNRLTQLENMVIQLTQLMEDLEDVKVMRETEAEYLAGDTASFAELLTEVQSETG